VTPGGGAPRERALAACPRRRRHAARPQSCERRGFRALAGRRSRARRTHRRRAYARRTVRFGRRSPARARRRRGHPRAPQAAPGREHAVTSGATETSRLAMPLAPPALAFAVGIALAPWMAPRAAWALLAAALAAGVVVLALGQAAHALAPLLAAVAMLGVLRAEPPPLPPEHVGRLPLPLTARLEARLDGEPIVWAADRARLVLDVECVDGVVRTGRVALTVYGPPPSLADGQRIAVEARLDRPVGFRDPGVFDATVRMAREGVFVMGSAPSTRVVPLEPAAPSWPARVRRFALAAFAERLPPVSAGLLSGLVLAAVLLDREASVTNGLALAAVAILAARPADLFDPGFQLSFAATAGIVAAPMPRNGLAAALAVSLAAQLAVLPVTLVHFNQVSTVGIIANLAAVPLAAGATVLGLLAVVAAAAADVAAAAVFGAVWPLLLLLRAVAALAAAVPGA